MVFPWIKVGLLSLNACTSATLGGVVSYCIFKGEEINEEKDKEIEALESELKKAKEDFEKESKEVEGEDSAKVAVLEQSIKALSTKQSCLYRMKQSYERTIEDLGWRRWFKNVRYGGEHCK